MTLTTKFDIGKEVFFMEDNRVKSIIIQAVYTKQQCYHDNSVANQKTQYSSDMYGEKNWIDEKKLFSTKEELIATL